MGPIQNGRCYIITVNHYSCAFQIDFVTFGHMAAMLDIQEFCILRNG